MNISTQSTAHPTLSEIDERLLWKYRTLTWSIEAMPSRINALMLDWEREMYQITDLIQDSLWLLDRLSEFWKKPDMNRLLEMYYWIPSQIQPSATKELHDAVRRTLDLFLYWIRLSTQSAFVRIGLIWNMAYRLVSAMERFETLGQTLFMQTIPWSGGVMNHTAYQASTMLGNWTIH